MLYMCFGVLFFDFLVFLVNTLRPLSFGFVFDDSIYQQSIVEIFKPYLA